MNSVSETLIEDKKNSSLKFEKRMISLEVKLNSLMRIIKKWDSVMTDLSKTDFLTHNAVPEVPED